MQPREIRDIAIECMARLDGTAATVKEACREAFFLRYRSPCGQVMGGFADVINAVVHLHPEMKPSEPEWVEVAGRRRHRSPTPPGLQGLELVRSEVETVARHVRDLREQSDVPLARALDDMDANIPLLIAVLQGWETEA